MNRDFLGPVKSHEPLGECDLEPKKVETGLTVHNY